MKYYSEKTKKLYDTEKEILNAEKSFDEEELKKRATLEAEKARLAKIKENRAERAKEIDELLKQRKNIDDEIDKKIKAFIRDYGSYHRSFTLSDVVDDSFVRNFESYIKNLMKF